jgi:hypothetical protein
MRSDQWTHQLGCWETLIILQNGRAGLASWLGQLAGQPVVEKKLQRRPLKVSAPEDLPLSASTTRQRGRGQPNLETNIPHKERRIVGTATAHLTAMQERRIVGTTTAHLTAMHWPWIEIRSLCNPRQTLSNPLVGCLLGWQSTWA